MLTARVRSCGQAFQFVSSLAAAIVIAVLPPTLWAGDWYVDVNHSNCASGNGSASQPFRNIADAINASTNGDTIYVAPGTYPENLVLPHDLGRRSMGLQVLAIDAGTGGGNLSNVELIGVE